MSLENGILGFLSIKPMSGYDLKKLFDFSAAFFWPADQAQIYRALKKLVKDGSAEMRGPEHGKTVERKVYAITDKGRKDLHDWITNPKGSDLISRLPFLMQLFFSSSLSREEQLAFLNAQQKENNGLLQRLRGNFEKNGEDFIRTAELSPDDPRLESAVYAHRWGILRGEAYGKFLKEIEEEIRNKEKPENNNK